MEAIVEPFVTAFRGFVVDRLLDTITFFRLLSDFKLVSEVVIVGAERVVSGVTLVEDFVGPVISTFVGFIVEKVADVVTSFVVVSIGFAVVSLVVVVGKLVVVITTAGMEVTTCVSLLVKVSGTDAMV